MRKRSGEKSQLLGSLASKVPEKVVHKNPCQILERNNCPFSRNPSMADSFSWSSLPPEILRLIFDRLNDGRDFLRCTFVCSPWRKPAMEAYHHKFIPLLLILNSFPNQEGEIMSLFNVSTQGNAGRLDFPPGFCFCGSTNGWLVKINLSFPYEVHLLNPLSGEEISLPPLISFEFIQWLQWHEIFFSVSTVLKDYIKKAVSSKNPSDPDCIAVIIYTLDKKLAFCRRGDKRWTDLESEQGSYFEDIVLYNGLFYAIDGQGDILYCDFSPNPKAIPIGGKTPFQLEPGRKFFAESMLGGLWIVLKKLDYEDSGAYVISFEVYEMGSGTNEWKRVNSLKGQALFLSPNGGSAAVFAGNCGNVEGNSVYFIDVAANINVFGWEDKQIRKLFRPSYCSSQLYWIIPADVQ